MGVDITTRRAIEICLSRLTLCDQSRTDLCKHLSSVIRDGEPPAPKDPDALMAAIFMAEDEMSGIDLTFKKSAIISRFYEIRRKLKWARRGSRG